MFRLIFLTALLFCVRSSLLHAQSLLPIRQANLWGLIAPNGHVIASPEYEEKPIAYQDSFFLVKKDRQWGVIHQNGEQIVPFMYDGLRAIPSLQSHLIYVKNGREGLMETQQWQVKIPAKYAALAHEAGQIFKVTTEKGVGLVNMIGDTLIPPIFHRVSWEIGRSFATVGILNKEGVFDFNGNWLVPALYDQVRPSADDSLFFVVNRQKKGVVDRQGKILLPPLYDSLKLWNDFLVTAVNRSTGLISLHNLTDSTILAEKLQKVTPLNSEWIKCWKAGARYFNLYSLNTRAWMRDNFLDVRLDDASGLFYFYPYQSSYVGIMDSVGRVIVPATQYERAYIQPKGTIIVERNGKMGLLRNDGTEIIPPMYDVIYDPVAESPFLLVKNNNLFGLILPDGKVVVPVEYQKIGVYAEQVQAINRGTLLLLETNSRGAILQRTFFPQFLAINVDGTAIRFNSSRFRNSGQFRWQFDYTLSGWGLFSTDGINVLGLSFSEIKQVRNTGYWVGRNKQDGELYCYVISADNAQVVLSLQAQDLAAEDFEQAQYARVKRGKDWDALTDLSGNLIEIVNLGDGEHKIDFIYSPKNGRFRYQTSQWMGFIDAESGKCLPVRFDEAEDFFPNQKTVVTVGGRRGLINENGAFDINPQFEELVLDTVGDLVKFRADGKWGLCSFSGEELTPPSFDKILPFGQYHTFWSDTLATRLRTDLFHRFNQDVALIQAGGKTGYLHKNGQVVLPPKYERVGFFWNGAATFKEHEKFGVVALDGRVVWEAEFDSVMYFNETGVTMAQKNGKWGMIDLNCTVLYPFELDEAFPVNQFGFALVQQGGKMALLNHLGKLEFPFQYEWVRCPAPNVLAKSSQEPSFFTLKNSRYLGLISADAKLLIRPMLQCDSLGWNGKLIELYRGKRKGFANLQGDYILKPVFNFTGGFDTIYHQGSGQALVRAANNFGLVDHTGKMLIPPQYQELRPLHQSNGQGGKISKSGLFVGQKNTLCGLLSDAHQMITNFEYHDISVQPWLPPYWLLTRKDSSQWVWVDTLGQASKPFSAQAVGALRSGLAAYAENKLFGIVDRNGNKIAEAIFQTIGAFEGGGAIAQNQQGKFGVINHRGQWTIEPSFDRVLACPDKAVVQVFKGNLQGYADRGGRWILPMERVKGKPMLEQRAVVSKGNHAVGLINEQGDWVISPQFTSIQQIEGQPYYKALEKKGKKSCWVLFDRNGKQLSDVPARDFEFTASTILVKSTHKTAKYGMISRSGTLLIEPKFESIKEKNGYFLAKNNQKYIWFDSVGHEIPQPKVDFVAPPVAADAAPFFQPIANKYQLHISAWGTDFQVKIGEQLVKRQQVDSVFAGEGGTMMVKHGEVWRLQRYATDRWIVNTFTSRYQYLSERNSLMYLPYSQQKSISGKLLETGSWSLETFSGESRTYGGTYHEANAFSEGAAAVNIRKYYGIIDLQGNTILAPEYEDIQLVGPDLYRVATARSWGYFSEKKGWIWKPASW